MLNKVGSSQSAIDLSIIIVSWNVWDLLRACLRSIEQVSRTTGNDAAQFRAFGPVREPCTLEVIVVDNASSDATPELIPSQFPWVRLIRSTTNLGFTRGNNRGYVLSQGQFVFFLNPDTEIINPQRREATKVADEPVQVNPVIATRKRNQSAESTPIFSDSLWQLFSAIRVDETIGLVGPQLRYADNTLQDSRRRFPTPFTGFFESTWLGRMWPNNPWSRRMHMANWPSTFRQDTDWLVGAAMLARRTTLEAVRAAHSTGPFDENFFMYSEELDLCRRIKQAGWRIVYVPEASVVHYEGRSSEQIVAARHIHFNTSKVHYYQKYFGARWAAVLRHYLLLEFRLQLFQERVKRRLHHKPTLRTARIEAYRQVIQSGLNPTAKNT